MTAIPTTYLVPKQTQQLLQAAAKTTKIVDIADTFLPSSPTSEPEGIKSYRNLSPALTKRC